MVSINGTEWSELTAEDVKVFLNDCEESFYFEFKGDAVKPTDLIKEISALSNTYGGYIFVGVSDNKEIIGCSAWDEQRIHTTIHGSIFPVPLFDVKKFKIDGKDIYVIKINEGPEPPYITVKGKIFERISSGSFPINDSNKLIQLYNKREEGLKKLEHIISIDPIPGEPNNIYAYIDVGFATTFSDVNKIMELIDQVSLEELVGEVFDDFPGCNIMRVAGSIVLNLGNINANNNAMPVNTNNFIEIMYDGSVRMRVLLLNNDKSDYNVNMFYAVSFLHIFKKIYKHIFRDVLEEDFIYAKKYEKIKTLKQFYPTYHYEIEWDYFPELAEKEQKFQDIIRSHQASLGVDTVITDNRIPKVGLYTIDKNTMEKEGIKYNLDNLLDNLFACSFVWLGYVEEQDNVK